MDFLARLPLLRILRARPRLTASAVVGLACAVLLPAGWVDHAITRAIVGWNAGALLYLLLAMHLMFGAPRQQMRARARAEDEGRWVVLSMVILSALVSLAAVLAQLSLARDLQGGAKFGHIALAGLTIVSAWGFTQVMFALHYAHDYYLCVDRGHHGGLDFPGEHAPDYGDFLYFACVIGTSGQTADVSFTGRAMRRVGTLHCVLAFVFNTTILALCINMASSLI